MGRTSSIVNFALLVTIMLAGCGRSLPAPPEPPAMDGAGVQVRRAVESAYTAASRNPADLSARSRLGRVYHANTFSDEARAAYEQVIEVVPGHAWTLYWLAMLEQQSGNQDRADVMIQRAADAAPEEMVIRLRQASWALDAGDPQQVEALLKPLRASHPNHVNVRILDARLALELDQPRAAVDILTPMVKSKSPHPYWRHLLGRAHRQLGNERESYRLRVLGDPVPQQIRDPLMLEVMKERRGFNPAFKQALSLQAAGKTAQAIEHLENMMVVYPERSATLLNSISRAHFEASNFEQAREALDDAYEFDPENAETHVKYSVLLARDQPHEALKWARQAQSINPMMHVAHTREAKLLLAQAEFVGAIAAADEALRLGSTDSTLHQLRGMAFVQLGRLDEARDALVIAVEAMPLKDRLRLMLVEVQFRLGDQDAAIALLEQGLILKPDNNALLNRLRKLVEPPVSTEPLEDPGSAP